MERQINGEDLEYRNIPITRALVKMTPERMKTIIEALLNIATTFLTKNCPQNPANTDTSVIYKAAHRINQITSSPKKKPYKQ